jgi:hypothetical protein
MKASFLGAFAAALALTGCSGSSEPSDSAASRNDLGTGANTVTRKYSKPAADVWDAAESTVKSYNLSIESDRHDQMGGEIVAHRASGERVTVNVRSVDDRNTDAVVRVDPGNRNLANLIHEHIADKLGMGHSKAGVFGDTSVSGTYAATLDRCVAAADSACRSLGLTVTGKDLKDKTATVDAREANSNPVRVQMDRSGDAGIKATFSAGSSQGSDPKALTAHLKTEFERQLGQNSADPR